MPRFFRVLFRALWSLVAVVLYLYSYLFLAYWLMGQARSLFRLFPWDIRLLLQSLDQGRFPFRIATFVSAVSLFFVVQFLIRRLRWSKTALACPRPVGGFLRGLLLGLVMVLGNQVLCLLWGAVSIEEVYSYSTWKYSLLAYAFANVFTAIAEELVVRGYILPRIHEVWGRHVAVGVSALIFGGLHVANQDSVYVLMAIIAGVFLGYAYVYRGIYYCIGWHYVWNVVESTLYSGNFMNYQVEDSWILGAKHLYPDHPGWSIVPVFIVGLIWIFLKRGQKRVLI